MSVRIPDMPDLGTPTDDSLFVADHVGSGVFTGAALRAYAFTGTLGSITAATLHVTDTATVDGPGYFNSTLTSAGHLAALGDFSVEGDAAFSNNMTVNGGILTGNIISNNGFTVQLVPPFGLYPQGLERVLEFAPNTYIQRNGTTGSMEFGVPTIEAMRIVNGSGAVQIWGGPLSQIGTFGTDGYISINGGQTFSSGSIGAASLVINGGGHGPNSFDFYTNGLRLNAFGADGQAYKPGGGAWADVSDARIKTDIQDYASGLAQVLMLRPVTYRFKPETERPDQLYHGLIAQEAETAMPEMVTQHEATCGQLHFEDMRQLDTTPLLFALVNAVQELAERVAELETAP